MGDTPSKPYRAVTKNGNDQRQDKELHKLEAGIAELNTQNDKVHNQIIATLEKYIFAGKAVWAVIALVSGSLLGGVGWLLGEVASLRTSAAATQERDDGLEDDIEDLEDDLRALRRLVNEHQRSKDEHLQRQRSKE